MLFKDYFTNDKLTSLHNQFKSDYWVFNVNENVVNWILNNFKLQVLRLGGVELIIDEDFIDIEYLGICLDVFNLYYLNILNYYLVVNKEMGSIDDFKLSADSTQTGNNSYENSATNNDRGSDNTKDSENYKGFDLDNQDNQFSVNNVEKTYSNNRENKGVGSETNTMTSTTNRQDLTQFSNILNNKYQQVFKEFRLMVLKRMGRKIIYG